MSVDDFKNSKDAERLTEKLAAQPSEAARGSAFDAQKLWEEAHEEWRKGDSLSLHDIALKAINRAYQIGRQPLIPNAGEVRPNKLISHALYCVRILADRMKDATKHPLRPWDHDQKSQHDSCLETLAVCEETTAWLKALAASTPAGPFYQHHIFCSTLPTKPLGTNGCICVITYKKRMDELEALERAGAAKEAGGEGQRTCEYCHGHDVCTHGYCRSGKCDDPCPHCNRAADKQATARDELAN